MICIVCNREFESYHNIQKSCSKECRILYLKEYYQKHKVKILLRVKNYNKSINGRINRKKWLKSLNGKDYKINKRKTYKRRELNKRHHTKRNRDLNFISLNSWFPNSHGHHINKTYVIYIPKELHIRFIGHSSRLNKKMVLINMLSFNFLINGKY